MTFIILIAAVLFGLYFLLNWFAKTDSKSFTKAFKIFLVIALVIAVTLLLLSGRAIHGLVLSILIFPFFFRWSWLRKHENENVENQKSSDTYTFDNPMTAEEACEVLGVNPGASPDEIISAHKAMMKRVHPDHGGSNYLAQQINEAKDVLLKAS